MFRFPNPGSSLENFVAVFTVAFEQYRGQTVNLDHIVEAAVSANRATSSGHMGQAAIARSTRSDRSRDPLYNQMKMYTELFRWLGWLRSTESSALNYTFTLLGEQLIAAGRRWKPLVEETVLSIAVPTHVIKARGNQDIRPFSTILQTMLACNNGISRDEMIVGPLSTSTDRTESDRQAIVDKILAMRNSPQSVKSALETVGQARGVEINTLKNYTRWPIGIMRDLGWVTKGKEPFRNAGGSINLLYLTQAGLKLAQSLEQAVDLRVDQIDGLTFEQKRALSRHAHFAMMERTGFDVSSVVGQLKQDEGTLRGALKTLGIPQGKPILFSPFQTLSVANSREFFSMSDIPPSECPGQEISDGVDVGRGRQDHLFVTPTFVTGRANFEGTELETLKTELCAVRKEHPSINEAARSFAQSRCQDTQTQFYPLVVNLFRLMGFRSEFSRAGVNYQRWDACVWMDNSAIPIEIKSPAEEICLSTKAIRQAIENKVILLSRGGLETRREFSTLVVGFQIPNQRSDVCMLIDDVYATFKLRIGVIDLQTLAYLAIKDVTESISVSEKQLSHLKGILDARCCTA